MVRRQERGLTPSRPYKRSSSRSDGPGPSRKGCARSGRPARRGRAALLWPL